MVRGTRPLPPERPMPQALADPLEHRAIPKMPALLAFGVRMAPHGPADLLLTQVTRRILARHAGLLERLGPYRRTRFVVTASDVPLSFLLDLARDTPAVSLHREPPAADAHITGSLAALVGLVHGVWDGDALFFSRDLTVEGDTSAVLALRNAIDDAELDIGAELAGLTGPLSGLAARAIARLEAATGVPLTRAGGVR